MSKIIQPARRAEFWAGVKDTIPLVIGAIPFGIIFGANAVTSGLSPAGTMAMSAFVFAGASQFIAADLILKGATEPVIIFTTLIVNLRHALYSASLAPFTKHLSQKWLVPLGFWLTDESFVVTVNRYNQPDESPYKHWYFFGSTIFMYINWQLCTYIGLLAGQNFKDAQNWGLQFAATATFIGMVIPLMLGKAVFVAVVVAGICSVIAHPLSHQLGLVVAAILGIVAGMVAESYFKEADPKNTTPTTSSMETSQ